jgi:tetratricopeptide (TPR) repeat protein/class 3 adenylate cyclase
MSNAAAAHNPLSVPASTVMRRTIAVVDMVAFSSVARMLEENATAAAVYELSRQIQSFFNRALAQLPDPNAYSVVSKPGDGIILLFERPDDAHCFGYHVHHFAAEHNAERKIANAKRWFRVGIASGDVVITDPSHSPSEYAGITIANAVRLESAAEAGEILVDLATFGALSSENQARYGPEETVCGKREERFRARRCEVTPRNEAAVKPQRVLVTRRAVVAGGTALLGSAALGVAWLGRARVEGWIHRLPPKRFVAVMDWPKPADARLAPTVRAAIDAIETELARAEMFDPNLYILPLRPGPDFTSMAGIDAGANLALTVSAETEGNNGRLYLRVMNSVASKTFGERTIPFVMAEQLSLPSNAVQAAAELLNIAKIRPSEQSNTTGTRNPEAYAAFQKAEADLSLGNDDGLTAAINGYNQAISKDSGYALAFAKLALAYFRKYIVHHNRGSLGLAEDNCGRALLLNGKLIEALLAFGNVLDSRGNKLEARKQFATAYELDRSHPITLLQQAQFLTRYNDWRSAETRFAQLRAVRPNYWLAHEELAVAYSDQGKYSAAVDQLLAAAQAEPGRIHPLVGLSAISLQMGNPDRAISYAHQCLELKDNDLGAIAMSTALRCKGTLNGDKEMFGRSVDFGSKAKALGPDNPDSWMELGEGCSGTKGRENDARDAFTKASELQKEIVDTNDADGPTWMSLALAQAKTGKIEESSRSIEKTQNNYADDLDSQIMKVRVLELQGKRKDALTTLAACRKRNATMFQFQWMPDLDGLRKDPEFNA